MAEATAIERFEQFGFDKRINIAITRLGFQRPTAVQVKCVPLAMLGKDILARARTGSGKTMAYAMPIVQKILHQKEAVKNAPRGVRCVVLVPTKELSEQVRDVFGSLIRYTAKLITVCSLAADESVHDQKPKLAELPDVVITTPSRLAQHIKEKNISLAALESLVVDEADLVLSFGYDEDVRSIATVVPASCQAFLMSATLTEEVDKLKNLILHNPVLVKIEDADAEAESNLKQFYLECTPDDKFLILYAVLRLRTGGRRSLIFVNSIDHGYKVKLFLDNFGIRAAVLNSELPATSRAHILSSYNRGVCDILIATDEALIDQTEISTASTEEDTEPTTSEEPSTVDEPTPVEEKKSSKKDKRKRKADAAETEEEEQKKKVVVVEEKEEEGEGEGKTTKRKGQQKRRRDVEYGVARGIDFKGVDMVINFDMARNVKSHVHRIGRTARAGAKGQALSLLDEKEAPMLKQIEAHVKENNQAPLQPYSVTVEKVSGFKYRVEDILRGVSKNAIRDARLSELKTEILNSQKLKSHFEDHQRDLDALRHDKPLHSVKLQPHLKHIPTYLAPTGIVAQQDELHAKIAKHKKSEEQLQLARKRKRAADPLRTFSTAKPSKQKPKKDAKK